MKKTIKDCLDTHPQLEKLLPLIKKNVGFVMTNGDLKEIRELIESFKVPAMARAGAISPCNVSVPAQTTTLGPEKTSFFQALSIPTKITRGMIEITANVCWKKVSRSVNPNLLCWLCWVLNHSNMVSISLTFTIPAPFSPQLSLTLLQKTSELSSSQVLPTLPLSL